MVSPGGTMGKSKQTITRGGGDAGPVSKPS